MRLKFLFSIMVFALLFSNCKGKQPEISPIPSYIPVNKSQSVVLDLANLFSKLESDSLSNRIIQYQEKTTNQIAVLTIDSLPKNKAIQNFGTEAASIWGVGTKEKDNGLLITISKFDRKVAISTGIGTEQTISDNDCQVVIDRLMIPEFRKNDYYKGVNKALDSLILLWD